MSLYRSLSSAASIVTLLGVLSVGCTIQQGPDSDKTSSSGGGGGAGSSGGTTSGSGDDGTPRGGSDPGAGLASDGPVVVTIHAAELVREFQTNSVRASELYTGKRVRVFGTVNSVGPDDDKIALVFKTSVTTTAHLFCRFTAERAAGLSNLNTGDEATADGTVVGIGGFTNGRLILENCSVP